MQINILIIFLIIVPTNSLFAYIGPGMGGGLIAAIIGIFGAIIISLIAVIYYPIKRFILRKKNKTKSNKN